MRFNFENIHWSKRFALAFAAFFLLGIMLYIRSPAPQAAIDFIPSIDVPVIETTGFVIGFLVLVLVGFLVEVFVHGSRVIKHGG